MNRMHTIYNNKKQSIMVIIVKYTHRQNICKIIVYCCPVYACKYYYVENLPIYSKKL